MIKGDIDLTENLDFYHDKESKKKQPLPLIPWKKHVPKIYKQQTYTIDNYSWTNINNLTYPISTTSNNDIELYNLHWESNNISGIYWNTLVNSYNTAVNNAVLTSTVSNIYYNTISRYIEYYGNSTIEDPYITFEVEQSMLEDKYITIKQSKSCFGEHKSHEMKGIRLKEYYIYNDKCLGSNKEYDRREKLKDYSYQCFSTIKRKRPKYESNSLWFDKYFRYRVELATRGRGRSWKRFNDDTSIKIPWLRKLSSRIYHDYMEDLYQEQDYSSYLTNMSWLRIY